MFGLRKTLSAVLLAVFFIVLASLATSFYNSDKAQQEQVANSELVQKSQSMLGSAVGMVGNLNDKSIENNNGFGKKIADLVSGVNWAGILQGLSTNTKVSELADVGVSAIEASGPVESGSIFSGVVAAFKDELASTREPILGPSGPIALEAIPLAIANETVSPDFFNYQKTDTGAEIIFRLKTGWEYKMPLPFKFLSNN
ncbi:MAG: hypothetical protein ACOYL8_04645 [Patescibacteria group bacterium]